MTLQSFSINHADTLMQYTDECIEGANALGQRYITWPWLDPAFRSVENFKLLTGKLNAIGERVNKAGLGFAYHNPTLNLQTTMARMDITSRAQDCNTITWNKVATLLKILFKA